MRLVLAVIIAFLLGSVPTGFWIGKIFYGKDIRKFGSGNIGATNTLRVLGTVPGIIALAIDILKGAGAVLISSHLVPTGLVLVTRPSRYLRADLAVELLSGIACIAGHNWSIFLRFKGGKGVATSCGVFLALAPRTVGISLGIFLLVAAVTRYVSLSSIIAAISFPVCAWFIEKPPDKFAITAAGIMIAFFIVFKHRSNIHRLIQGNEARLAKKNEQ